MMTKLSVREGSQSFRQFMQTLLGYAAMSKRDNLRFNTHDLAVACYSASAVVVEYAGTQRAFYENAVAPAKTAADEARYPNVKFGAYRAFEGPLRVWWRASNGDALECVVELVDAFPGREVLHTERPEDIYAPMPITGGQPIIIVEVNDRTLMVFMLVTIQLIPHGARDGARIERDHRTLAFSITL